MSWWGYSLDEYTTTVVSGFIIRSMDVLTQKVCLLFDGGKKQRKKIGGGGDQSTDRLAQNCMTNRHSIFKNLLFTKTAKDTLYVEETFLRGKNIQRDRQRKQK
jgi:hypothetical protein